MNNKISNKAKVDSVIRQEEQREIAAQVEAFLAGGGEIEKLPQPTVNVAPKSRAWPVGYGSFEG